MNLDSFMFCFSLRFYIPIKYIFYARTSPQVVSLWFLYKRTVTCNTTIVLSKKMLTSESTFKYGADEDLYQDLFMFSFFNVDAIIKTGAFSDAL